MRFVWMMLFFLLPIAGLVYTGWHVWAVVPLSRLFRGLLITTGVLAFLTSFLNFSHAIDRMPLPLARLCYDVGNSSIFILLYLVLLFLLLDAGRLLRLVPAALMHRCFLTTALLAVGVFVVFLLGNIHYRHKVREELCLTTTKPLLRPLRIVMASDLHLGYHNPRAELARWVDLINAEHPDVVLIAGDIIDMSIRPLIEERMAEEFRRLNAPVYACLGNHEYYSGEQQAQQFFDDAGICLLRDSCVQEGPLLIVGRDDRANPHRKSLRRLLADSPAWADGRQTLFTILLDHQPHHLEQAQQAGFDFQFSGHTHRGQVWPISWVTDYMYECSWGSYQRGLTRYYVSSGLGIWGAKFRIGTQSEYVVATLMHEE